LLERCLGDYTQNNNESFNSVVWSMALKTEFSSGKIVLNIALDIIVCNFNDGLESVMEIMQVLEMLISYNCYNFCMEADAQRIKAAERSLTEAAKKVRRT